MTSVPTTTQAVLELWQNTGRGLFVATKLNADGTVRGEPVRGGAEFQVTGDERRTHSGRCAGKKLDPYFNGLLIPKNEAAVAGQAESVRSQGNNPWSNAVEFDAEQAQADDPAGFGPDPSDVAPSPALSATDPAVAELQALVAQQTAQIQALMAMVAGGATTPGFVGEPPATYQVLGETGLADTAAPASPFPAAPAPAPAPAPVAAAPAKTGGPSILTGEERAAVLTGNGNKAKALLRRIDSAIVVEQLLAQARESGTCTPNRQKLIESRLAELDPNHQTVNRSGRTAAAGSSVPGAQDIDMDNLHEPQAVPGAAQMGGEAPAVYQPGEGDDDGPILTTPGSVTEDGTVIPAPAGTYPPPQDISHLMGGSGFVVDGGIASPTGPIAVVQPD